MPSLEYLIEKEVVPVLKDIADSLKKIANPAYVVSSWAEQNPEPSTFRVRFGDNVGIYDTATGRLIKKVKEPL